MWRPFWGLQIGTEVISWGELEAGVPALGLQLTAQGRMSVLFVLVFGGDQLTAQGRMFVLFVLVFRGDGG